MRNKSAVVTGASKGIGAATVLAFAKAGYAVAINYFHSEKEAENLRKECESLGVNAVKIKADCRKESEIQKFSDEVFKVFGPVDVLVNNFGHADEPDFERASQQDIVNALTNNLVATMLATRIFAPRRIKKAGSILNVASIYGLNQSSSEKYPIYSAAKAGVINFTQSAAKKYAPDIRCNAVAPGFTKTPHWDGVDPERTKFLIGSTLQKEWVYPEDVGDTLVFLAESQHINAETIVIDAGWSKR